MCCSLCRSIYLQLTRTLQYASKNVLNFTVNELRTSYLKLSLRDGFKYKLKPHVVTIKR